MNLYYELKKLDAKQGTIRVILIQSGKKMKIATGQKIDIKDWGVGYPKIIGRNSNINLAIDKYKTAFNKYITNKNLANELPSLSTCKVFITSEVKNISTERGKKDIWELIEEYKELHTGIRKHGSLQPFTTLSNHLKDFNSKLQFSDIDGDWVLLFAKFLSTKSKFKRKPVEQVGIEKVKKVRASKDCQNPTINKMLVTLKIFCKWAFNKKHTSSTGWLEIKRIKEEDQTIITLEKHELIKYFNYDFGDKENLAKGRDIFCFATFCGLRYNDLLDLNKSSVKRGSLDLITNKTGDDLNIKLIPEALEILKKYNYVLPLDIAGQTLNKNIKAGVKKAGINRKVNVIYQYLSKKSKIQKYIYQMISIHDARKTFVTLCIDTGLSIPEVMKMSTHDSYSSFTRYMNKSKGKGDEKLPDVFSGLTVVA